MKQKLSYKNTCSYMEVHTKQNILCGTKVYVYIVIPYKTKITQKHGIRK